MKPSMRSTVYALPVFVAFMPQTAAHAGTTPNTLPAKIEAQHTARTGLTCLFLDKVHHRLAAQAGQGDSKPTRLVWLDGGSAQRLTRVSGELGKLGGDQSLLGVDFPRGRVFSTSTTLWGWGGYLHVTPLPQLRTSNRDLDKISNEEEAHLSLVAAGKQQGMHYRVYFPVSQALALPEAWAGVYSVNKRLKRVKIGYLPKQVMVVAATDQVYFVSDWQMKTLDGRTIPLPNGKAPEEGAYSPEYNVATSVIDTDSTGQMAYYIDSSTKNVYKLSISTGAVVGQRSLPFVPQSIVVDNNRNRIYLLDSSGKRYIATNTF